ncbi:hypothetical protein F5880DRAFT_1478075 [Lentinula raphanica]|nr:hypothetical protein F5880DRAFT_1478075 [Lentinula raphanica]
MSFAGTPLGQGRRLDHQSFLGKPPSKGTTTIGGGNTSQNTQSQKITPVPSSYSYGAPLLGSRSPPKTTTNSHSTADLHPEKWSVRDTSVNAATAIYQAMTNPNDAWASSSKRTTTSNPPRSTSVEYESQANTTTNSRRLGLPPSRLGPKAKPLSMTGNNSSRSIIVPDSEGEQSQNRSQSQIGRDKSPFSFDHLTNLAQTAIQKTSYFVKEKQKHVNENGDASYDYEAEDRDFEEFQRRNNGANPNVSASSLSKNLSHRKNRISTDNKAYKPTQEELDKESSSSEDEDGARKRRKKKAVGGPAGGPLTTLPKVGPEKRRKRGSKKTKSGGGDEGDDDDDQEEQEQVISQSQQLANESHSLINHSSLNLDAIPEDPDPESNPGEYDDSYSRSYLDGDSHSVLSLRSSNGVGARLGVLVHTFFSLTGTGLVKGAHFFGRLTGWVVGLLFVYPIRGVHKLSTSAKGRSVGYYFLVAVLVLIGAWVVKEQNLTGGLSTSLSPLWNSIPRFGSSKITYTPPALPVENADELNARLRAIESALGALTMTIELKQKIAVLEGMIKGDIGKRVERVEGELNGIERGVRETEQRETNHKKEKEALEREMEKLKNVVGILQARPIATSPSGETSSDVEARAQLALLEERLGAVEGGVKEAIDLGKSALKDLKSNTNANTNINWWSKLSSSSKTPGDEQELVSLLSSLISSALSSYSKDMIARADYALHSGGARVIPSLTSDTFTLRPQHTSWTSQFLGAMNPFSTSDSNGLAVGRPPVWALHPDITNGLCWPFNGAKGQLGIALAAPVVVDSITVDHKKRRSKRRSAPREMEVWGLVEGRENVRRVKEWKEGLRAERDKREDDLDPSPHQLDDSDVLGLAELDVSYPPTLPQSPGYIRIASFTYDIHSPEHIQTFPVLPYVKELGVDFGVVVVLVGSNWGMEDYTCLYRVRVHGERVLE